MLVAGLKVERNMSLYPAVSGSIRKIPDHLKIQEMCNEVVNIDSYSLFYVLDQYKNQRMCNELMCTRYVFFDTVPDCFKTQEISIKAFEVDHGNCLINLITLKHKKMCDATVNKNPLSL